MCLKVTNEIGSFQFKLVPSAWCVISLVISIHMIFLHLAYVDDQPEIDSKYNIARLLRGVHGLRTLCIANSSPTVDLYLMGVVVNLSQAGPESRSCRYRCI